MVNKSEIVKLLFSLFEKEELEKFVHNWKKEPAYGFPWKKVFVRPYDIHTRSYDDLSKMKDILIVDASQLINRLTHKGNFDGSGPNIRYKDMSYIFNAKVKKMIRSCNNLSKTGGDGGCNINDFKRHDIYIAFDNSNATAFAKLPEQRERRLNQLKKEKSKIFVGKHTLNSIRENDFVPNYWSTIMRCWPGYGSSLVSYLIDMVHEDEKNMFSILSNDTNLYTWKYGTMMKYGDTNEDDTLKNFGEVDHATLTIMMKEVEKVGKDGLNTLIFRLNTVDTDLLLYAFWFLEHVDMIYDLNTKESALPLVYIIRPNFSFANYRVINVTKFYCVLKRTFFRDYRPSVDQSNQKIRSPNIYGQKYTSVRSMVVALISWGNDYLPNVRGITAKTAFEAYTMMGFLFDKSPFIKIHQKTNSVIVQYKAIRLFYCLMFYYKYSVKKPRCTKKCKEEYEHTGIYDSYEEAPTCEKKKFDNILESIEYISEKNSIDDFEREIVENLKNRAHAEQHGGEERIRSRYKCLLYIIHFVNHALCLFPNSMQHTLRYLIYSSDIYVNVSEQALEGCDLKKLEYLGLYKKEKMLTYSDILYTKPIKRQRRKALVTNRGTNSSYSSSSSSSCSSSFNHKPENNSLFESTPWKASGKMIDDIGRGSSIEVDRKMLDNAISYEQAVCAVLEIQEHRTLKY